MMVVNMYLARLYMVSVASSYVASSGNMHF